MPTTAAVLEAKLAADTREFDWATDPYGPRLVHLIGGERDGADKSEAAKRVSPPLDPRWQKSGEQSPPRRQPCKQEPPRERRFLVQGRQDSNLQPPVLEVCARRSARSAPLG
jgi:hypothetical protein